MFSQVCVILFTGGVSASVHAGIHTPPLGADTPHGADTPPGADTPWSRHPPGTDTHLPGSRPPGADTPQQTPWSRPPE